MKLNMLKTNVIYVLNIYNSELKTKGPGPRARLWAWTPPHKTLYKISFSAKNQKSNILKFCGAFARG